MNNITIAGRIGRDAELRFTNSGEPVCGFSVADDVMVGKEKATIWWRCNLWGKRAESLNQYLVKGASVTVSGSVGERKWVDKDGMEKTSMEVRVNDIALQGGKQSDSAPRSEPRQAQRQAPAQSNAGGFDQMDDDVPF